MLRTSFAHFSSTLVWKPHGPVGNFRPKCCSFYYVIRRQPRALIQEAKNGSRQNIIRFLEEWGRGTLSGSHVGGQRDGEQFGGVPGPAVQTLVTPEEGSPRQSHRSVLSLALVLQQAFVICLEIMACPWDTTVAGSAPWHSLKPPAV